MTRSYLGTSAAMKLVIDEPESIALSKELATSVDRQLVASWLLHTELQCAAGRHPTEVARESVQLVLDLVDLIRGDLLAAGATAPLRTNDAIHLAVALRLGVDEMVTYDGELAKASTTAGLIVVAPGATSHSV